jgi:hypothetical protein
LNAATPSIVVLLAPPSVGVSLLEIVEARWPPDKPRPIYLLANSSFRSFGPFLADRLERRRRIFGIMSDSSSLANARFVQRYNETREPHVTATLNPAASYDAVYLLAYGIFATDGARASGPSLAHWFTRLTPPGPPIEVGPTQMFDGLQRLQGGGRIDLEGAGSGLDFDVTTGEAPSDFALLCAGVGADGRANDEGVESGVVYRAKTKTVDGRVQCP